VIDALTGGQVTINANQIPEPGSALLMGGALLCLALRFVRRTRQGDPTTPATGPATWSTRAHK
jgi:hypothetical protein